MSQVKLVYVPEGDRDDEIAFFSPSWIAILRKYPSITLSVENAYRIKDGGEYLDNPKKDATKPMIIKLVSEKIEDVRKMQRELYVFVLNLFGDKLKDMYDSVARKALIDVLGLQPGWLAAKPLVGGQKSSKTKEYLKLAQAPCDWSDEEGAPTPATRSRSESGISSASERDNSLSTPKDTQKPFGLLWKFDSSVNVTREKVVALMKSIESNSGDVVFSYQWFGSSSLTDTLLVCSSSLEKLKGVSMAFSLVGSMPEALSGPFFSEVPEGTFKL